MTFHPEFVRLTKLVDGFRPMQVWINPDRIGYLQERIERRGRGHGETVDVPRGTRIYFTDKAQPGAGFIDVQELPEVALALLSGDSSQVCSDCHSLLSDHDIEQHFCPTCEQAREDAASWEGAA